MEEKNNSNPLSNFEPNVVAAFAYLFPFVTGIAFFMIEKENKFIRYHAAQAVLFWLAVVIAGAIVDSLFIVLYYLGSLTSALLRVATIVIWLFLIWKAYNKEEYELPYLGKIAKDQANK